MNRENQISKIALSMGLFALCQTATAKSPTNVLFIIADDLGWNDIACMGSEYHETPNIKHHRHNLFGAKVEQCHMHVKT